MGEMRAKRFVDLLKDTQQVKQDLNPSMSDSGTPCMGSLRYKMEIYPRCKWESKRVDW